jgi:hypothetical protein
VSVAIAAVIGVPTLRLSGHYFSMATIAVAELVRLIVTNTEFLGAAVGLSGPTVPRTVLDLSFTSALPYYYLFLSVLLITLGITWWMTNSRMGFYLRAIRDSERAARSLGAPASRTKLAAFMLSAGLTSVAGALYAMMFGFVDPESGLGILISVKMLIMAALGGAGLLFGPLVGAAILVPLEEISNNLLGGKGAGLTFQGNRPRLTGSAGQKEYDSKVASMIRSLPCPICRDRPRFSTIFRRCRTLASAGACCTRCLRYCCWCFAPRCPAWRISWKSGCGANSGSISCGASYPTSAACRPTTRSTM